jgi:plasmid stability protein
MAILTVRNVPDEVHRALRLRAAEHGRSTEAEVREILALAVKPAQRMRMGEAMAAVAREAGVTDADVAALPAVLDDAARQAGRVRPAPGLHVPPIGGRGGCAS